MRATERERYRNYALRIGAAITTTRARSVMIVGRKVSYMLVCGGEHRCNSLDN